MNGGPKSAAGKAASRRNALRHGLSARALLPEILGRDLIERTYRQLRAEWQPATLTEEFCVREMARHQAALERVEHIEDAVLRRGARGALDLFAGDDGGDDGEQQDVALAGAGTSEAIERITRYRRSHERAFAQSLVALRSMQELAAARQTPAAVASTATVPGATSRSPEHPTGRPPPAEEQPRFKTEAECEAHLRSRFEHGDFGCPTCQGRQGHWIASRGVWQCRACRRQTGLRAGTVMAGSRLPLLAWFRAIESLLRNPDALTDALAAVTGIRRAGTVRRMACRIRQAMASDLVSAELAGLDSVFGAPPPLMRGNVRS